MQRIYDQKLSATDENEKLFFSSCAKRNGWKIIYVLFAIHFTHFKMEKLLGKLHNEVFCLLISFSYSFREGLQAGNCLLLTPSTTLCITLKTICFAIVPAVNIFLSTGQFHGLMKINH